jgi:mannose-6-phosphate isomerase-like protein (cupin superfamily)
MTATAQNFTETAQRTTFPHGHEDVVALNGASICLALFEPGWRWTNDVRPLLGTESCPLVHQGYMLEGNLHVELEDGSTLDLRAGDAFVIPPRHDAWVVGDDAVRMLDWGGKAREYARPVPVTS